jgi:hypothetical protein
LENSITHEPFTLRNIRIADDSGTIRVQLFNYNVDCVQYNKKYVFYQLKKKVRFERHQLEVFSKSHVEKIPDEGGVLSDIMSEDEESGQTRSDKFVGSITGINNF